MNIALEELIKSYELKIKQCYARQEQITTKDYARVVEEYEQLETQISVLCAVVRDLKVWYNRGIKRRWYYEYCFRRINKVL